MSHTYALRCNVCGEVDVLVGGTVHSVVQKFLESEVQLFGEKMLFESMAKTAHIGVTHCTHTQEIPVDIPQSRFRIWFCDGCGEVTHTILKDT